MICRFIQFRAGLRLDDRRPLPLSLERHIAHCPRCNAWHQAQRDVAGQLRQQRTSAAASPASGLEPSPLLQEKILQAITTPVTASRSRRAASSASTAFDGKEFLWFRWAGGIMTAAAAIIVAAVMLNRNQDPGTAAQTAQNATSRTSADHHSQRDKSTGPTRPGNPLMAAAENFDKPLRRELALLNEDARSAVRALKASFLPSDILPFPGKP